MHAKCRSQERGGRSLIFVPQKTSYLSSTMCHENDKIIGIAGFRNDALLIKSLFLSCSGA